MTATWHTELFQIRIIQTRRQKRSKPASSDHILLYRAVRQHCSITDDVKDCACELVELLYQADKNTQQAAEQGGVLQSYSNDGESGTFDLSQSIFTEEGKQKKVKEIIYRYLGNTGLLYQGV